MAKVAFRGGFPAGQTVGLHVRVGDTFAGGKPIKTAKVRVAGSPPASEVVFSGVKPGKYWVAAEIDGLERAFAINAKDLPPQKRLKEGRAKPVEGGKELISQTDHGVTVSGVRTTADRPRVRGHVKHTDSPSIEQDTTFVGRNDGAVALGAEDAPELLASDTIAGTAHPADPGRPQQADVDEKVVQSSSTEHGDAAPVQTYEQVGDVPADVPQRSHTEQGSASPVAISEARKVADAVGPDHALTPERVEEMLQSPEIKQGVERSRELAASPAPKPRSKSRAKGKKGGLTAAQRSARSKKAAETRKRNAAKK